MKENPQNKSLLLAVIILSALVAVLSSCVIFLLINGNGRLTNGDNINLSDGAAETILEAGNTDVGENTTTMTIKTPYCEMKYPSKYNEYIEIKEFNENGIYTKQFLCTLSSGQYFLFAVHFGEGAGGEFFGYLVNGEEKISVYIECYNNPGINTLSEEDSMLYYYMMDGINEIAKSISETTGYATH